MIQLSGAAKRFGHKLLFEDLNWLLTAQDRCGLVGANGTGKSTLLKILAGLEPLDDGLLTQTKGITAGYLPQDGLSLSGRSVFDECLSVFAGLRDMEREMEALTHQMAELDHSSPEYRDVGERYHLLEGQFRAHDGYALEAQVGQVLTGLGFRRPDWARRTEEFSGGWQMRIALAKLLLQKPNLLLLDEPTNHLDLEARNWLESYLGSYPFAYVVISHDRYFLDVTVNKTVEIWNKRVHFYTGNYEKYLREKEMRQAQVHSAYRNQQERVEQLEAFINRFRYQATKARQVQSRIKELERMERVEIPPEERTIHFSFPQPPASGRIVAEFKDVAKSYGSNEVFRDASFLIERGERIALVGANGAGKSTLIKLLAGIELPTAGEYRLGHNAQPNYFAQDQYKELDVSSRMLDDLGMLAPRATQTELRSLLGCFLFSEDDVFKPLGVLSGGERNRYALARMLLHPSNFLLLDEPTNHLDLRAKDVLLESLQKFTGTVVFVSHDRYFIDKLATRVFEIGEGHVHAFPGNYEDFLWRKENPGAPSFGANGISGAPSFSARNTTHPTSGDGAPKGGLQNPESSSDFRASRKRINPLRLKQMKDRCDDLEEQIARFEAEIADAEQKQLVFVSAAESKRLADLLDAKRAELAPLFAEWEELSQAIETADV